MLGPIQFGFTNEGLSVKSMLTEFLFPYKDIQKSFSFLATLSDELSLKGTAIGLVVNQSIKVKV